MSKTWRQPPQGAVKEPRPPEKGGHKNIYKDAIEEEFMDFDEEILEILDEEAMDFYEEN